jgi:hypothetical protein
MPTLWVCNVAGGPFEYLGTTPGMTPMGLEEAHRQFHITPDPSNTRPGPWSTSRYPEMERLSHHDEGSRQNLREGRR